MEMSLFMLLAAKPKESKQKHLSRKNARPSLHLIVDQDQNQIRRRKMAPGKKRSNRLAMIVTISVALLVLGPLMVNVHRYYILNEEFNAVKDTYADLLLVQDQLMEELDYLDTPEAIERLARENLGMIMPGETLVNQAIAQDDIPRLEKIKPEDVSH
jgi:cell division protein FtsB